ncbi:hypothetical protein OG592_27180 [Streptomyces avidinii]|uniref:hypothetical protein n=1 Tax=Streptomyces avidinii TaxID=1895 RepID=UPI003870DE9C|nr:hypothetical protein OG592_27180 [Streptomyces avidinii]
MTPGELEAAITADCPHRLPDYQAHWALLGWQATPAFIRLWRIEHAISSQPALEAELDRLHGLAEDCPDYAGAKDYLEQVSRIRCQISATLDQPKETP